MTAVIEAKGLAKSYGKTRALDGVSFTVEAGRIVADERRVESRQAAGVIR